MSGTARHKLIAGQIRLVGDANANEKKGSKKKHTGYAFVVFEREKDMKGTHTPYPLQSLPSITHQPKCSYWCG